MSDHHKQKLRVGIIVDSTTITKWQSLSLEACADLLEIKTVLYCHNAKSKKSFIKHSFYYLLNLVSINNRLTKGVAWSSLISESCLVVNFECLNIANWQSLDVETHRVVADQDLDLVIKFGMHLLKDPHLMKAKYGILSFHHGDPSVFRGRPSGFYELTQDVGMIGVVVQELSNSLDAGKVRAFGSFEVKRHSYRKTLEALYRNSAVLLRTALLNCESGEIIDIRSTGRNYRLPSNRAVVKFAMQLLGRKLYRIYFGMFMRRDWQIGIVKPFSLEPKLQMIEVELSHRIKTPRGLMFVADPFVLPNGTVLCEATRKGGAKGFLTTLTANSHQPIDTNILGTHMHLSFPFVLENETRVFILPEMVEVGSQLLCELDDSLRIIETHQLLGLENERLVDPVLLNWNQKWWIFAGRSGSETDHLHLWSSDVLFGPYMPHPLNPIVMSPARARNAGAFILSEGELFRVGQDNRHGYGDGITISQVIRLDDNCYQEKPVTQVKIVGERGPHTLSFHKEKIYVDFYWTVFDPLAWLTRLKLRGANKNRTCDLVL